MSLRRAWWFSSSAMIRSITSGTCCYERSLRVRRVLRRARGGARDSARNRRPPARYSSAGSAPGRLSEC